MFLKWSIHKFNPKPVFLTLCKPTFTMFRYVEHFEIFNPIYRKWLLLCIDIMCTFHRLQRCNAQKMLGLLEWGRNLTDTTSSMQQTLISDLVSVKANWAEKIWWFCTNAEVNRWKSKESHHMTSRFRLQSSRAVTAKILLLICSTILRGSAAGSSGFLSLAIAAVGRGGCIHIGCATILWTQIFGS